MKNTQNITNRLGLKLPIIQAPLEYYPNQAKLVSMISNAGCLGVYSTNFQNISQIKTQITSIKNSTSNKFAVLINSEVLKSSKVKTDLMDLASVQTHLEDAYIDLNIKQQKIKETNYPSFNQIKELVFAEKISAVIFQNTIPTDNIINEFKQKGIYTFAIASNILEAIAIQSSPIDTIILQGFEAAGMLSKFSNDLNQQRLPAKTLLNKAQKILKKPMVIWGDDQVNIETSFIAGADAVMIDTALWTVTDGDLPNSCVKKLQQSNETQTVISSLYNGYEGRILKNKLTAEFKKIKNITLSASKQQNVLNSVIIASIELNNTDYMPIWANLSSEVSKVTLSELTKKYLEKLENLTTYK